MILFSPPLELNAVSNYVDDPSCFKVGPLFKILEDAMLDDKDNLIENVRGIYCFKVKNAKNQEGMWIINAKVGKGSVTYCGKGNFLKLCSYCFFFFLPTNLICRIGSLNLYGKKTGRYCLFVRMV